MSENTDDCLDLLVSLPLTRLCHILAAFSTQQPVAEVWTLLLWLEWERVRRPLELRPGPRLRLSRSLLPGGSLARLQQVEMPFSTPVFELVTSAITQPLLGETSDFPKHESLVVMLDSWRVGAQVADQVVGLFLNSLPVKLLLALGEQAPKGFVDSKLPHCREVRIAQRAPFLLESYLFLLHREYLPLSALINLHTPETSQQHTAMLAAGLFSLWDEITSLYRRPAPRSQPNREG